MSLYIRVIVGKHCLDRLLLRLNDVCSRYKMTVVENKCEIYWKEDRCYEMSIRLSPCPCITCEEVKKIYLYLFRQEFELEEDENWESKERSIVLVHYACLDDLIDTRVEKYFVMFFVYQKCISDYHNIDFLRS